MTRDVGPDSRASPGEREVIRISRPRAGGLGPLAIKKSGFTPAAPAPNDHALTPANRGPTTRVVSGFSGPTVVRQS